ncbi:MAG: pentapeptide repeat-containing protein, partial [Chloroflexi bacterium]|nr:pentapeptide repeat-containing protein [Chloroflexota bacterium]
MANQEHLDILKQGVEVWNAWRAENEEVQVDLRKADLRKADLTGANLYGADLTYATH